MSERHGIVVGIDGSPSSQDAVRWAEAQVGRFGALRPVYVWATPILAAAATPFGYAAPPPYEEMEAAATRAGEEYATGLGIDPSLVTIAQGDPGVVLATQAADANALVIGTRSRGPFRANLLGSTGRYCADHATAPMIIVPHREDEPTPSTTERIVVGIDGSANSLRALEWAMRTFPAATITAVTSWQTPVDGPVMLGGGRFDVTAFRAQAEQILDEAIEKVCAETGAEPGDVGRRITEGDPRWTLAAEHGRADLLVLGRRGRGGLSHLVLGSTTTSLIHQPERPVAVIPPEADHD